MQLLAFGKDPLPGWWAIAGLMEYRTIVAAVVGGLALGLCGGIMLAQPMVVSATQATSASGGIEDTSIDPQAAEVAGAMEARSVKDEQGKESGQTPGPTPDSESAPKGEALPPGGLGAEPTSAATESRTESRRLPVPSAGELRTAENLVREVLASEFAAAKAPPQKSALAGKLLALALDTEDDPLARFALCTLARDLALEGFDLSRAWEAVQLLGRYYVVDESKLKTEIFERLVKETRGTVSAEANLMLIEGSIVAAREAALAGKSESVSRLLAVAQTVARRLDNPVIRQEVVQHAKAVESLLARWNAFSQALKTLEVNPSDPAARTTVGLWKCMVEGNWDAGLPYLVGGNQPTLAAVAALDLKARQSAVDPLTLAERWFEEAEKLEVPYRYRAVLRAKEWFQAGQENDPEIQKRWQPRLEAAFLAELALFPLQYGAVAEGNVALARAGAQVVGSTSAVGLTDGIIPPVVGPQGMAIAPYPCEWTVVLQDVYRLREIRVKLPDPGKSVQFFVLSVSPDGKNFQVLADHSKVPSAGWQRFIFLARPVKAIRLQGISHTGDKNFYVSELEAYTTAPAPWIVKTAPAAVPGAAGRRGRVLDPSERPGIRSRRVPAVGPSP